METILRRFVFVLKLLIKKKKEGKENGK